MAAVLITTFVVGTALTLVIALLVTRHAQRTHAERKRARIRDELRPLVIEMVADEAAPAPEELRGLSGLRARMLGELLGSYATTLKGESRRRLVGLLEQEGYVDQAVAALSSRGAWKRAAAAQSLGEMSSSRAVQPLGETARDDADPIVRMVAARALGSLGDPRAVPLLLEAVERGVPPTIFAGAAIRIGEAAVPLIERAMEEGVQPDLLCDVIGRIGVSDRPAVIRRMLDDPEWEVRTSAARAMGRVGGPASVPALLRLLAGDRWQVRAAAARSLGRIGEPEAFEPLVEASASGDYWADRAAAEAACRLRDGFARLLIRAPDLNPALLEAIESDVRFEPLLELPPSSAIPRRLAAAGASAPFEELREAGARDD